MATPCSSSRRRILCSSVSSSGVGPPNESDRPWQTKGNRSVNERNALPSLPPTLIQFSGATSKKSMGAWPLSARASCSGPMRARRRPSPAPRGARVAILVPAAGAFLALLVGAAGAFLTLLVGAAGTFLALGLVGGMGFGHALVLRGLVRHFGALLALGSAALAFAALAFVARRGKRIAGDEAVHLERRVRLGDLGERERADEAGADGEGKRFDEFVRHDVLLEDGDIGNRSYRSRKHAAGRRR